MNKYAKILTVAAVLLLAGTLSFAQELGSDRVTVPFSNPGKPGFIEVHVQRGSITVKGYNGSEVVIEVTLRESRIVEFGEDMPAKIEKMIGRAQNKLEKSDKTAGLKKLSLPGSTGLSVEESNNRMEIRTRTLKNSVDLVIQVPFSTSLDLTSLMGGEIEVDNVKGEIEASNMTGAIKLLSISGTVLANSMNGGIEVAFVQVNPDKPMSFSTMNGDIDVTLPASTKANLKIKTDLGEVYSDFEIAVGQAPQKIEAEPEAEEGRYRILFDKYYLGAINGGGPEFVLKTRNGDILIRKAK
ncbi:MAG: DUF4097 domain-containing protein [Candidatus Aminicenantes bacterium]|nr:DUF4097 domain-containing protein [Candidatus Aminicenantes bacterium]